MTPSVKKAVTKHKVSPGDGVDALFTLMGTFQAADAELSLPLRFDFKATRAQTQGLPAGDYVVDIEVALASATIMLPTEVIAVVERVTE